jgi:hypothetical protein
MSSRERWIVYPLLFFAFCLGARDQFVFLRPTEQTLNRLDCQVLQAELIDGRRIVASEAIEAPVIGGGQVEAESATFDKLDTGEVLCEELAAVSQEGRHLVELGANGAGAGRLTVLDGDEQPAVTLDNREDAGVLESRHDDGTRLIVRATAGGGVLVVVDSEGQPLGEWPVEFEPIPSDDEPREKPGQ